MKTVLLIAQHYPPCVHTASKRTGCFAKYLGESGWQPIVLCPEWTPDNCLYDPEFVSGIPESVLVYRVPMGPVRKWSCERASDLLESDLAAGLRPGSFLFRAKRAAAAVFREHQIDVVWSTWPASSPNLLAAWIARRWRRPWVADFRDIIGNVYVSRLYSLLDPIRLRFQKRYLRRASALVTISEGHARVLEARHGKPVCVIPNGFDPDDLAATNAPPLERFLLLYTGIFSTGEHTDFRPVLDAIARLGQSGRVDPNDFEVEFMGKGVEARVESMFAGHALRHLAKASPPVARQACLARQRSAAVLLQNAFPGRRGVMTGKIFEYLAARRPILAIPRDGDCVERMLETTGAGYSCTTVEEIADRLLEWYAEWKQTGTIAGRARLGAIMPYSRKAETEQLAMILSGLQSEQAL